MLYRGAKRDLERRLHVLFDKVVRSDVMGRAWDDVRANKGAPGVDGVSIEEVEIAGVRAFFEGLAVDLWSGRYRPLRRVHILKPGRPGQTRPLGMPHPNRRGDWVLDADIKACFDEIDDDVLMACIGRCVIDRQMLKLLRCWLRAGIFEGGVITASGAGTPQGSLISPLLANIALRCLDQAWQGDALRAGALIRYADDFVIVCRTADQATDAWQRARTVLGEPGLRANPGSGRARRRPGSLS